MTAEEFIALLTQQPIEVIFGCRVPITMNAYCRTHSHRGTEIVYHADGCSGITEYAEAMQQAFCTHSVVMFPAYQIHSQRSATEGTDYCLIIQPPPALRELFAQFHHVPLPADINVEEDFRLLAQATPPFTPFQQCAYNYRLGTVLATLAPYWLANDANEIPIMQPVEQAARILQREYSRPLRVAEIAERLGVSESYLRHHFVKTYGKGMTKWLSDLRIARAQELLAHTMLSHQEIARQCGLNNEYYFSYKFRQHTGISPRNYRYQQQKEQ